MLQEWSTILHQDHLYGISIKKSSIVLDQIPRHTCKEQPFVILCAETKIGEDELVITENCRRVKLAAKMV